MVTTNRWYVAAAIVLVAMLGVVTWRVDTWLTSPHAAAPMVAYVTANGQRATIMLPDSSQVILNVASRLEVPADYERGNHHVRLVGEALFKIAHHDANPFTVTAGSSVTRVLGTSFLVRHYTTDSLATVAVRDGKVSVQAVAAPLGAQRTMAPSGPVAVILTAMQQVLVGQGTRTAVKPTTAAQFGFATGVLTLNHMPLAAAIRELDRWYDADIRVSDPALMSHEVTGEFTTGSLTDLSELLDLTFGVRVVRDGRVLTLYPRG
jgi:transmembrane sensor